MKKKGTKVIDITLLSLFSMCSNSGVVSVFDVLKSLRNSRTPWITDYKKVIPNANLTYVKLVLSKIFSGQPPVLLSNLKKGVKLSYELDMIHLKNGLVKKIKLLISRNPVSRVDFLVNQVVRVLVGPDL